MSERQVDNPKAFLDELCRHYFVMFLRKAWPLITGGEPLAWNWHLDALACQLGRVADGGSLRLIVNLPPRNGKSKTVSVIWIAWMLGMDPTLNFVCVSYSNELSAKLGRDCLALMQSRWYRELFPRTIISQKRSAAYDFETSVGGGRLATSITGTLTGRGGDIIVLDDVIKPEEAASEVTRNSVNEWFRSTLSSRLDDKSSGAIILVMQRLHQDDLCGMLLEAGGWDHLCLRAIAVEDELIALTRGRFHSRKAGELLHVEREPARVLAQVKASMGSVAFAAQYQQEPVPATGNMVEAAWLMTYERAQLPMSPGRVVQSWDTATKENPHNDWSVCVTALQRGRDIYILNVFRRRLTFPKLRFHAISLAQKYQPVAVLIEDQSSGTQLLQALRSEPADGVPDLIRRRPEGDKVARVAGVSAMIEAGRLFLPTEVDWLADFRTELLGFPNTRFDDQVDALAQLLIWIRERERFDDDRMVYAPRYGHKMLGRR